MRWAVSRLLRSLSCFLSIKARRTPQSSAWLRRHLRKYWLNIGLSVLDFPGECIYLFVMAMGEGDLTVIIPRFFERISYVASTGERHPIAGWSVPSFARSKGHLAIDGRSARSV